jgi:4-amino-4-deoxy-L-arabinose transferase-like glycosyltransferase
VFVLLLAVYLGSAFSPALFDDADATHAEAAREMVMRGDYVTLHVNGVRYLEKAPLMYWLVALCYRVFGVNEFAARLPTIIAVLLSAALAMAWAQRAFGARASVYAGLFVPTTTGFYLFTRILLPEAILSLLIAASLYFFLTGLQDASRWRWYSGYACIALAVLTKGLVALVFVGAASLSFLLLSGEWRRWREFHLASGSALLILIAAPWHLLAGYRNQGFFWFYFVNEHFLRFLGKRYPKDYNKLPATLYWSLHLAWLFPWSMYLPVAVQSLWRDLRLKRHGAREHNFASRTRLLCWVWAGIILIFFSLSTNQEYYTFPTYFPLLLLLAGAVAEHEQRIDNRWLLWGTVATAIISVTAGGALIVGLWTSRNLPYVADIGTVLSRHNLADDTLSMSHMLDLSGESFAALRLPATLALLALMFGPPAALFLRVRRQHYAATWTLACTMGLFFAAAHIALERFEPYMSSKSLASSIAQQARPGDHIMIYGDQAFGSSLLFYLEKPVQLVNGRTTSMWFGSTFPDAPKIYLDDSDLVREWDSSARVFLFVPPFQKAHVDLLIPSGRYVVAESSGKTVYSNRPGI